MEVTDLLKYCKLYRGENSMQDNPITKQKDEFAWEMWRVEYVAVHDAISCKSIEEAEDFISEYIRNKINIFADEPFGGDPRPYYERYYSINTTK